MANRPVFVPDSSAAHFVKTAQVEFTWYAGLSLAQKQRSIASLHEAAMNYLPGLKILEISSKSPEPLGVRLSAFNLKLSVNDSKVSVETAFQSSKVFESGGPYLDLLHVTAREAKTDKRLKESGDLVGFQYLGENWPLEPKTAFYDWLYLSALAENPELADGLMQYDAFTDIEFNPERSINCQASSAALYVFLVRNGRLNEMISDRASFLLIGN